MTFLEFEKYITSLIGHVTFEYDGYSCGVDPLSNTSYDMWFGDDSVTVDSIDKVMNLKFFKGKSLKDIWDDITELDF